MEDNKYEAFLANNDDKQFFLWNLLNNVLYR